MLGRNEFALRQGFACGKTLVRRKRAAPPCGALVLSGIYTLRTRQKETPADRLVFLFAMQLLPQSLIQAGFPFPLYRQPG